MSSTCGLICLNHDPAIEFGDHETVYDPEPMLAIARNPGSADWAEAHARCDLVVARYSYPIVGIGCPGSSDRGHGCRWHRDPIWIDVDVLRLLAAAYQAHIPEAVTEPFASRCWKRERVLRLAPLLGLDAACLAPPSPSGHRLNVVERDMGGARYTIIHPPGHGNDCPFNLAWAPLPVEPGVYGVGTVDGAPRWMTVELADARDVARLAGAV